MEKNDLKPTPDKTDNNLFMIREYVNRFFKEAFALDVGVDKRGTINEIKNKKSMSGPNAWMLICSIVIACIGLNTDSPAVIIGAMLISPLMSPILGIGLSVGINDKETLKASISHFSMAVIIALVVSFIYFSLTPLTEVTEQIMDRTKPGPLDVVIGIFGGIAGIVSIARKDISTTLPGVAIATALMPPLCVAGYGLANFSTSIVLNSFFLFFINSVFVAFATYFVVHFILKFPQKDFVNAREKRNNTIFMITFLLFTLIVSYFPFSKLIKDRKNERRIEEFVNDYFKEDKKYLDSRILSTKKDSNLLIVKVYGDAINDSKKAYYDAGLKEVGLENTWIEIIPTTEITLADFQNMGKKIDGIQKLNSQLETVKSQKSETEKKMENLKSELQTFRMDSTLFTQFCKELKAVEENVNSVTFAKGQFSDFSNTFKEQPIVAVEWKKRSTNQSEREEKLSNYLRIRLKEKDLKVVHEIIKK